MSANEVSSSPGSLLTGSSAPSTEPLRSLNGGDVYDKVIIVGSSSSSELSQLSTPPPPKNHSSFDKSAAKKRPIPHDERDGAKSKKKVKTVADEGVQEKQERGIYCHQCRSRSEAEGVLRCTKLKRFSKNVERACNLAFCDKCLAKRYSVRANGIRNDSGSAYQWTCPCCLDICQSSTCRKKKDVAAAGGTLNQRTTNVAISMPITVKVGSDSELSEPEKGAPSKAAQKTKPNQVSASKKKVTATRKENTTPSKKGKDKAKLADRGTPKGKLGRGSKAKDASTPNGDKKPRAKPVKKPDVPVLPPAFEKVDTRLGHEEGRQRMQLREFAFRFRMLLGIPERSLGILDDFDRQLTEASVRLLAGGMIDLIRDEYEVNGMDTGTQDAMFQNREELRYYADLARFATIYASLKHPLNLRLPAEPETVDRRAANVTAIRTLLDIDSDGTPPLWAEPGPARRTGASRIPQPVEVVRMLLAFQERCLSTPRLRAEVEHTAGEQDDRRDHARGIKKAASAWETQKKKLAEARVRCKSAAETKANKEQFATQQKEYNMQVAFLDVNLRAALSKRALRFEPLGTDLDGRIYYCLTPRPIEVDGGRPPQAWASGLLVWGRGVPALAGEDEELSEETERWSHFGKSAPMHQLIKWLGWRYKKAVEALKPPRPSATPKKALTTPAQRSSTPKKGTKKYAASAPRPTLVQSTLFTKPTATPKTMPKFELVLPMSAGRARLLHGAIGTPKDKSSSSSRAEHVASSKEESQSDKASRTSSSALSEIPDRSPEDLQSLLHPEGYKPTAATVEEQGRELMLRLREVATWLEVLEWKGMGEVH